LGPHYQKVLLAEAIDGPIATIFSTLAKELQVTLLVGSVAEKHENDPTRAFNTSLLYGPTGKLLAFYRKIHLFDVNLADSGGVTFLESDKTTAGSSVTTVKSDVGTIGMSICYDLRFPEIYRQLTDQGAEILTVPSAFTVLTGKAHWHTLLRARAIECQSYLLAPAQCGTHDDNGLRSSFGHSLIVDPWGEIIAECRDENGFCMAEIDLSLVRKIRREIPVGHCRRL